MQCDRHFGSQLLGSATLCANGRDIAQTAPVPARSAKKITWLILVVCLRLLWFELIAQLEASGA